MYIDYLNLEEYLNSYAIELIYDIIEKCGKFMSKDQIVTYENKLSENKIIIVHKPTVEDDIFFKGNIPVAHGPRAKKDGYIHIYPYKYKNKTTKEIIDNYINGGIILHELYHYLIKLDIKGNDNVRVKFGHYITEGMVEYLTELHSKTKYTKWSLRRNVDAAEKLYNYLLEKNNVKLLFCLNFEEIFKQYPELENLFEEYKKEECFAKELTNILNKINEKEKINVRKIMATFNRHSLTDGIEELSLQADKYLDEKTAREFNCQMNNLYTKIFEGIEKRLN